MLTDPDPRLPIDQAARLFGLLGDETRLRLLLRLAEGDELSVTALGKALRVTRTALNHRLQRLRLAGVVTDRREGQNVFYSLAPGPARDILLRHVRP
jgi:DNA-binding transcriptional ArsR family regulator